MDDADGDYDDDEFTMRIYDPETEEVPDFTSTIYVHMGLDDEYAPFDTTLVIIHPSVNDIKDSAFDNCRKLRRVMMHKNVEVIGPFAFLRCESLHAIFLPSSIKKIGHWAFVKCTNLRILSIPQTIDIGQVGLGIINNGRTFLRITQIPHYYESDQVNQALIDFNSNLPLLHKACLNTYVAAQSIHQCIETHGIAAAYNTDYGDGMTPMHILALNPHATTGAILTLFHTNIGVVFETYCEGYDDEDDKDDENEQRSAIGGKTLLECLAEYSYGVDTYHSIISALCRHRGAY